MQREIHSGHDYISELPESIIETILTKLPLKDTVRTSILSSKWRYKWATLTHLEFNDNCVSRPEDNLANIINHFLLLHDGPINKFALSTSTAYLQSSSDVDQWFLFLSRKDVKDLVLNLGGGKWYNAPSCLFSCQKLVSLELCTFPLNPCTLALNPPLSFEGFPLLKQLHLEELEIAPNVLENLISSCPLLETLNLASYDPLEITIRAPNLKYLKLYLEGVIKDICIENTPKLVAITAGILSEHGDESSSRNFDKFFGGVRSLQKLITSNCFTRYMSVGNTFGKTEMTYLQLKVIELSDVCFDNMKEIKVVLRLILNAPNLQQLQIGSSSVSSYATEAPDLDFWEKECQFDCTFERLKTVKMMNMSGVPHEVKFIGFLLGNSPLLETISITPSVFMTEDKFTFLIELTRFKRASTEAEMIFVQDQV